MSDIKKEQFEALEQVVNENIAATKVLAEQVKALQEQATQAQASVTVEKTKPEPVKNADPFEIKGVGTFTFKYPQFQIDKDVIKAVDIVKDAAAIKALYGKSPNLFIPVNK